jgi:hypothetical protein
MIATISSDEGSGMPLIIAVGVFFSLLGWVFALVSSAMIFTFSAHLEVSHKNTLKTRENDLFNKNQ